ncbi:MAG: Fe-S cluster assembly protein SufD [Micavibrio sp.]|nr:Fe-S cluster assembly protein SufD [Micavibrio sp.]
MSDNAARILDINNLPSQKEEAWKYTPLAKTMPKGLSPTPVAEKVIHCTCGQNGGQSEDILIVGVDGQAQTEVLHIDVEAGAELMLIERHAGEGVYWKNIRTQITLGKNAKMTHYRIQEDSVDAVHTNMVDICAEEGSEYNSFTLTKGAKLSRQDIKARLTGEDAKLFLNGVNILKDQQIGDTTILIEHEAPHCESDQFFRNVLDDRAKGVFQGKVHVHQAAQKTDANQLCKSILLSSRAEMNTKPELEIYADDVVCSHGATTGQIDDMQMFYMRSRGIKKSDAKMLLIKAFLAEASDKILNEEIRLSIEEKIEKWL